MKSQAIVAASRVVAERGVLASLEGRCQSSQDQSILERCRLVISV